MADERNWRDRQNESSDWNFRRNRSGNDYDNDQSDDYGRSPYYGSGYNQQRFDNDRDYRAGNDRNNQSGSSGNYDHYNERNRDRWENYRNQGSGNSDRNRNDSDTGRRSSDRDYNRGAGAYNRNQESSPGYSGDSNFAQRGYSRANYGYGTDFTGGYGPGNYADRFENSGYRGTGVATDLWEASVRTETKHRGKGPKGYQRSENRIREDVCDRLSDDYRLDASDIDVQMQGEDVVLTGTVRDRQQKRRAEEIVESVSGVKNVENRIRVGTHTQGSENKPTASTSMGSSTGTSNATSITGETNNAGLTNSINTGSTGTDTANADNAITSGTTTRSGSKKSNTGKSK